MGIEKFRLVYMGPPCSGLALADMDYKGHAAFFLGRQRISTWRWRNDPDWALFMVIPGQEDWQEIENAGNVWEFAGIRQV